MTRIKYGICLFLLAFSSMLAGCYTTGTSMYSPTPAKQGKALVYVYRENHWNDAPGFIDRIYINGTEIGALGSKRYFVCHVPPGQVNLSREMKFTGLGYVTYLCDKGQKDVICLSFEVTEGHEYYVMWKNANTVAGYNPKNNKMVLKSKEQANTMISKCRLSAEADVPR